MKVAYLLDLFPVLSETFIVREILELKKRHINVLLFARVNATDIQKYSEVIHDDTKKLMNDVIYLSSLMKKTKIQRWTALILLHAYFILVSPVRYVKTFGYAITKGGKIFNKFIFSLIYARELQKSGIDHMHVHFALHACTYALLISKITGIPYSFTVHAHDIFIPDLAELIEDKFNNAKFVVCISEFNKQYVLERFSSIDGNKIKVVHCGLDISAFNPAVKVRNSTFTMLSIGRLVEHKGFKYLIEACKRIKEEKGIDFQCNIIGEGIERGNLEELISAYGLSDVVHLSGAMEQADVRKSLERADVFILPCVTENNGMQDGIPVVLMEAMAMGIPVISTIVSGVPELVQDGSGILVEQRDSEELSTSIIKLMNVTDKEKEEMGKRGRAIVVENFNIEKEAHKLAELISC